MRTIDKLIPVVVIFLVGIIGYLLYDNKYNSFNPSVNITSNNIDEFFSLSKRNIQKYYGEYDYKEKYNNNEFYCYKDENRCLRYSKKNKVIAILLMSSNKLEGIKANTSIDIIEKKLNEEANEVIENDCKKIYLSNRLNDYRVTYSSKSNCNKEEIKKIDYILIEL